MTILNNCSQGSRLTLTHETSFIFCPNPQRLQDTLQKRLRCFGPFQSEKYLSKVTLYQAAVPELKNYMKYRRSW